MTKPTVLIAGASIAGPTLAFWLTRFGYQPTIVERADALRLGGQNIDISGAAQQVVRLMGIEDAIRVANTGELGVRFVDETNATKAELPKGESSIGTRELEILRGDLAQILYDLTSDKVEYLFGDQITALTDEETGVKVTFQQGSRRRFDLVICADGIRSRTRSLVFGEEPVIKPLGLYTSYFTVPRTATDSAWARWYNAPRSRVVFLRPDNVGTTRASFSFLSEPKGYERLPMAEQKAILKQTFADAGWEAPRLLAALDDNTDIYFDGISQVKAPRWSKGRCAMVGDAAYCPSPLSGMGTSLAIVGAYVLAGELAQHADYRQAFAAYENRLRPFVEEVQSLPPGVPWVAHPKTRLGIAVFNAGIRLISSRFAQRIAALFNRKSDSPTNDSFVLPDYEKAAIASR
ncbi:FAD-dependent monooxygenase [Fibrella aestuarina]|uniref:FAD-dependent monooxygenase n=1 Tax=Fibrella aestuarina TaxID=651143 RepID=UPI00059E7225|nr:FAD-dependent monooxygenase [Fibrella aestuarina]